MRTFVFLVHMHGTEQRVIVSVLGFANLFSFKNEVK